MNKSVIRYILSWVLQIEGALLLLPCVVALLYRERSGFAFAAVALLCLCIGSLGKWKKPKNTDFYARDGFLAVSLSWILLSLVGALPFLLNREIPSFEDALFETISGFTTTGASILTDVEALSRCSLFWRSLTHWIGGMGVLVFLLAILPLAGGNQMHLLRAESPGPTVGKLVPRMRSSTQILYGIYFVLTVVEALLLLISGMSMFDSLTMAFGTAGTGGFGVLNDSAASYTAAQQVILTVFMILFGVNFNVYYFLLIRKPKQALGCEEVRYYLGIIAVSTALILWNIRDAFGSLLEGLRHAAFQVASIITTTGFSTVDFNAWPTFSKAILVFLMFIGACAGSTGGGIKVSRCIVYFRSVKREIAAAVHPRNVRRVHLEGRPLDKQVLHSIERFLVAYVLLFAGSVLIVSLDNLDLTSTFTSVAATLNNIGPGLEAVGPASNFSALSGLSKFVLMFDMLAGRLELFPMLILFSPSTWKK